ncbi:hypothetical protein [Parasphingorhabdus sp.]|uniref:hypothetical protein n=1 Tax=Parasphingorhabdus sp. TaxID=2709688 RepID=UPI003A92E66C
MFGEAVARALDAQEKPLLTNGDLYRVMWQVFEQGDVKYLRGDMMTKSAFRRTRYQLSREGIIREDNDYRSCWRVMTKADAPAEDIICSVDSFCYVSHISAMQQYGLTNRRPNALHMTRPTDTMRRSWLKADAEEFFGEPYKENFKEIEQPKAVVHRERVRGRPVQFTVTRKFGDHLPIKGRIAKIATIGQTFLDMLDEPDACGGMAHVLKIWPKHGRTYLDEIMSIVDRSDRPILKVRAGYILDEVMGVGDERIEKWLKLAQRGSSRVLNSGKPFMSDHSEKWMLSLNV